MPIASQAQVYAVTTIAGTPAYGYQDGNAGNALFGYMSGLTADATGVVFAVDPYNHTIRKVTATGGIVSTFAGRQGQQGFVDGVAEAARFFLPHDCAADANGNVYVADFGNHAIRKISAAGVVTTLAGNGFSGSADGVGTAARFNSPRGVAVDSAGNVYVADTANNTVRKITPTGIVTTIAGTAGTSGSLDGLGAAARFQQPRSVAVDSSGNVFVADYINETIRKIAPDGAVTTFAGAPGQAGHADGVGNAARFDQPRGIDVDASGNVYVADNNNSVIRRISTAGVVSTVAGQVGRIGHVDAAGTAAVFYQVNDVAISQGTGIAFIIDEYNSVIRRLNPSSGDVATVAGRNPIGFTDGIGFVAKFWGASGIAFEPGGQAYVVDSNADTLRRITTGGSVSTVAGQQNTQGTADGVGANARFRAPEGVAIDSSGNVYITDTGNATVRKFANGSVSTLAGTPGVTGTSDGTGPAASFVTPFGITTVPSGDIFVSDFSRHTIRRITPAGVVTTFAGLAGSAGSADGQGAAARFFSPAGLGADTAGNVYVADFGSNTIRRITPGGVVTTMAGSAGIDGAADGIGTAARFDSPVGIAVDAAGVVYVGDYGNSTVRRIATDGTVTTIAGRVGNFGADSGLGTSSKLFSPYGLAVDPHGNVYFTDITARIVRKLGLVGVNPSSWISNLSVRADLVAGQPLIAGLVSSGTKPIVIRGVGPGLASIIPGTVVAGDPRLEMYSGSTVIDSNDNWGGSASLTSDFARLGAFALSPTSTDAALSRNMSGPHTVFFTASTSGVGLIEAYDGSVGTPVRLTNVAARYRASSGSGTLIAGFVVVGSGQKTLLIRGVGPSLTQLGVTGELSDPLVEVFNSSGVKIAESNDWGSSLGTVMTTVGAFALAPGSRDAAVLVSVPAGSPYTAVVSGFNSTVGDALVEVYEVGN